MLILLAYMKVLLLFLYFLPNNVGGCLVVKPKNPDLQNCKCSIDLFNQDDIRNNNGGSYLANQKAWNPIVTATDSCGLSITCDPIAGVSSFMTVMFRSNGNPLYLNRVVSGQSTYLPQPRSIDNLTCDESENGTYQWHYYGSPLPDLSLSCIADEDSCKCSSIIIEGFPTVSSRMKSDPNRCGYFNASCERPEGTYPFLFSVDKYAITAGSSSYV